MSGLLNGGLRWPRLRVLAGGLPLAGAFEADVVSNNHFAADRFMVGLAVGADPFALLDTVDRTSIEIEILVSLDDGAGFESLITGEADRVEYDPITGIIRLEGRDFSARLMEARVGESYVNLTASEIARKLASRHGLLADVQATKTPVGRLWEGNHQRSLLDQFSRAATEWDLLAALAEIEGFDLFVQGNTLHFRPGDAAPALPLAISEAGSVRLERALTLAGGIEVVVRSWHAERQESCEETVRRPGDRPRRYVYVVPNLTAAEAAVLAQRRLAAIGRHERMVSLEMPGELDIHPRGRIRLGGSGTGFDQVYWVDRVERRIGRHGFRQTVQGRNGNAEEGGSWSDS